MKVLVADDHSVFRTGLVQVLRILRRDAEVVEATDFEDALRIVSASDPFDLVLVDLLMPGMEPFEGLKSLTELLPDVPVVVVSAVENRQDTLRAIDLGAMGFIPKTASSEEFMRLLNLVLEGEIVLPRNVMDRRENGPSPIGGIRDNNAHNEQLASLTKRQRQVLDLLAQGKPNIEIARSLGVSEKTVRFYISAILKSLKVNNRTQAALIAAGVI